MVHNNHSTGVLYLPMGGLGGQKRLKTPNNTKQMFLITFYIFYLFVALKGPSEAFSLHRKG